METPAFLEDIYPRQLLYAVTIRSPAARGCLKMIKFPKMPPNYKYITARNIPGENRLAGTAIPILADRKVSYMGEPVALLFGQDKTKLEEYAAQCAVVVDPDDTFPEDSEEGPAAVRHIQIGDPQVVFEKAGKIVTGSYITGIQDHWYAEPAGAVTWYRDDAALEAPDKDAPIEEEAKGKKADRTIVVKTATQWPYHVKRSVARALGIEPSAVNVEPTTLSLHMDGKLEFTSLIACHAALGTFITNKPVRLILNREEDFLYSPKRCKANIDVVSTIDENGNITAADIDIAVDVGAYGVYSEETLDQVCLGAIGYYNFENLKLTARANRTNIPPQGPFSGFGVAQGTFAMERHVSHIADAVSQDPALWRKERADSRLVLPTGMTGKNHVPPETLIGKAASMSDYYRKWASYDLLRESRRGKTERGENPRGIGIALGFQGNGLLYQGEDKGVYSVEVTLTKESILEIKTSITSTDEDYDKIWAKLASGILSIEPEMVRLVTLQSPDCGPSCASRNITAITKLVEKCCLAIRKQRFHYPLPITVRRSVKPRNGALWDGRFKPRDGKVMDTNGFSKLGMAAAVVEVSIDMIECMAKIRGVWLVIDGGKIISQNRARRNLTRSAVQALGWAFSESIEYSGGVLPKEQYNNFVIPSPANIPPIYVDFLPGECDDPKGIGELPFTCIPAAFLQAVSQAMDHCYTSIPLKRKDVWEMVRFRKTESQAQAAK